MGRWLSLNERTVKVLRPKGDPVGFKLSKTEEEARRIDPFSNVNIALC